ncbi:MAG TPA: hypothetical protein VHC68_01055 [Candidatus Paceibacterota bacterium]|nr:hypothetical protein [Candidatus Paceibacterota bacterium]
MATQAVMARATPSLLRRAAWLGLWALYPLTWATWLAYGSAERALTRLRARARGWEAPPTRAGLVQGDCARYAGPALPLDGVRLAPGALILEVHIASARLARRGRGGGLFAPRIVRDLHAIAAWLAERPELAAVRCQTILEEEIAGLGFSLRPFREGRGSRLHAWLFQFFQEGYIILYHRQGVRQLFTRYRPLTDAWMGREAFIRRFARR